MVGNTYPYTLDDWLEDIIQAHDAGIDGFSLNMGVDEWQPARVAEAYAAAAKSGLNFKLFISLDMTSLPCSSAQDAQVLRNIVRPYLSHPNQLLYNSRPVVSTFSGQSCTFGQGTPAEGWQIEFISNPNLGSVHFIPSFFVDPNSFTDFSKVMDGDFFWNGGWPTKLTTSSVQSLTSSVASGTFASALANVGLARRLYTRTVNSVQDQVQTAINGYIGSMTDDHVHLNALAALSSGPTSGTQRRQVENKRLTYMAAVSPWFFTHYGADSYNKNFVYLSDHWLYLKRWESLIAARDQVDIVQLLSWNDFGESHYVGPIKGAQPNSQAWTSGFDHTAWLNITKYYSAAFKTGSYPPIETDQLYMWARTHPADARASNDPVGPPSNANLFQDVVWVMVMATQPSTVVLSTDRDFTQNQQRFDVQAGVSQLSISISPGGGMYGAIIRGNQKILELHPQDFSFNGSPVHYNFNVFIAGAQAQ